MHKPGHGPGAAPRIIALSNGDTLNEGRYRIDRELNRELGGLAQAAPERASGRRRDGVFWRREASGQAYQVYGRVQVVRPPSHGAGVSTACMCMHAELRVYSHLHATSVGRCKWHLLDTVSEVCGRRASRCCAKHH